MVLVAFVVVVVILLLNRQPLHQGQADSFGRGRFEEDAQHAEGGGELIESFTIVTAWGSSFDAFSSSARWRWADL